MTTNSLMKSFQCNGTSSNYEDFITYAKSQGIEPIPYSLIGLQHIFFKDGVALFRSKITKEATITLISYEEKGYFDEEEINTLKLIKSDLEHADEYGRSSYFYLVYKIGGTKLFRGICDLVLTYTEISSIDKGFFIDKLYYIYRAHNPDFEGTTTSYWFSRDMYGLIERRKFIDQILKDYSNGQ